mmetsp:Transcript_15525/g.17896  ORF Transcript_15525/g.17896 Transcript_15525/m.17896 type:complete len:186 (-) Transcript_15525:213-770(-)
MDPNNTPQPGAFQGGQPRNPYQPLVPDHSTERQMQVNYPQGEYVPQSGMATQQMMPMGYVRPNQPVYQGWEPGMFKNSFWGCFDDCGTCLEATFCPCILYGRNYDAIHGEGCTQQCFAYLVAAYFGAHCLIRIDFRKDLKQKFNIPQEEVKDCLLTYFCDCCAISQEAREIKWRKQEAMRRGVPF